MLIGLYTVIINFIIKYYFPEYLFNVWINLINVICIMGITIILRIRYPEMFPSYSKNRIKEPNKYAHLIPKTPQPFLRYTNPTKYEHPKKRNQDKHQSH